MADLDFFLDDDVYEVYRRRAEALGATVEEHVKQVLAEIAAREGGEPAEGAADE